MTNIDPHQLQRWSRDVERSIKDLTSHVNQLHRAKAEVDYERQLQAAHELVAKLHAQSLSYTNLIIVAGYAGILTFWSQLKADLPPILFTLVGFLIVFSLFLFISWEVIKMVWGNLAIRRVQGSLKGAPPTAQTLQTFQAAITQFESKSGAVWMWFLVPTVVTGLGAGALLLGYFCWGLVQHVI